jgi:hypothetical protein
MRINNLFFAAIISTLIACTNEKKAAVNPIPTQIDYASLRGTKAQKATLSNPSNGNVILNPKHGEPGHRCDIAVGMPLNSPAQKATTTKVEPTSVPIPNNVQTVTRVATPTVATAKGMNPPHGQPNHRCDIAVGAPLNSKPVAATSAATTTQPAIVTAKGMNPPHGQPNHRCDIAVGAPLNSKPPTTPASVPVNPVQPATTTGNPPITTGTGNN